MSGKPRRARPAWVLAVLALLAVAPARSGVLLLGDGRAVRYVGELRRGIGLVTFRLEDGTLVSLRESQIDWPASARAGALLRAAEPTAAARGPSEDLDANGRSGATSFERLSEERMLGALVHTGRSAVAPPAGHPVDLLLAPALPGAPLAVAPSTRAQRLDERVQPLVLMDPNPVLDPGLDRIVERELAVAIAAPRLSEPQPPTATTWAGEGGTEASLASPPIAKLSEPELATFPLLAERPLPGDRPILVSPRSGDVVFGATRLEARPAAGAAPVKAIEYTVDGALIGRVEQQPFALTWRAPRDRGHHEIVASIIHADGRRDSARARVLAVVPDAAVDVDLVSLQVTVSNQQYLFVRELAAADFVIYEDGVRMDVAHFSRDPVPLSILILVDASFSMSGQKLEMAKQGLARLVDRLGPLDRVGVAAFAEKLRVLVPLTQDRARARAALDGLVADGGTSMFDAQLQALSDLRWEGGRRVLIVLGDGEDYGSTVGVADVIREADRLDVAIYAVGTLLYRLKDGMPEQWAEKLMGKGRPRYWTDVARVRGIKFLRQEVEATGGILYLPKFAGELPYVFEHVLTELKSAYSLGYYPKRAERDGGFRAIDVSVRGAGLEARTRRGYYAVADGMETSVASGTR